MTTIKPDPFIVAQSRIVLAMGEQFAVSDNGLKAALAMAKWLEAGFLVIIRTDDNEPRMNAIPQPQ